MFMHCARTLSKFMNEPTEIRPATPELDDSSQFPATMAVTEPLSANYAGQKRLVRDIGSRLREIANLKPGSSTIRTPAMIAEIIDRLRSGETLLSITCDPHICSHATIHNWMDVDADLDASVQKAREIGAQVIFDARMDVALAGAFSTGDRLRDELVIKVMGDTAAKRNRNAFGDRSIVDVTHSIAPVMLPTIALPTIPDAEFDEIGDEDSD
jgi:hypothetical protein